MPMAAAARQPRPHLFSSSIHAPYTDTRANCLNTFTLPQSWHAQATARMAATAASITTTSMEKSRAACHPPPTAASLARTAISASLGIGTMVESAISLLRRRASGARLAAQRGRWSLWMAPLTRAPTTVPPLSCKGTAIALCPFQWSPPAPLPLLPVSARQRAETRRTCVPLAHCWQDHWRVLIPTVTTTAAIAAAVSHVSRAACFATSKPDASTNG